MHKKCEIHIKFKLQKFTNYIHTKPQFRYKLKSQRSKFSNHIKIKELTLPHATLVLKSIRTTLKRSIKMAMNFMFPLSTLINKREFKKRSYIGSFTSQRDENGNISRTIFRILAVRIEVDRPLITSDGEHVARNVFSHSHSLRKRVALDQELVRAVKCLRNRPRN